MSDSTKSSREWAELLAGQVLGDLSKDDLAKLEAEGLSADDQRNLAELEATMVRIQLAFQNPRQVMPEDLQARIIRDSGAYLKLNQDSTDAVGAHAPSHQVEPASMRRELPRIGKREVIAWLACAAALLLAFGFWRARPAVPIPLSLAERRSELIANAPDVIQVAWSAGKHPFANEVRGDVVWSTDQQTGFMRFVQMPVNQPTKEQYQLWIIDPARDEEPIDGGVFNISETGEVIIPIDAKLPVLEPAAFAITIEKPGGVVVSTQDRLPLLAAVQ